MKFIKIIIKFILSLIILFCTFQIFQKQLNYYKDNKENKEIQKLMFDDTSVNLDNKLLNINGEYKLWINIPNTKINYPVVQTNNNEYYLNHSFKKKQSIEGTLFIYDNYKFNSSKNLIIFGHNMKNDSMFGTLSLFKNKNFLKQNSIINIIKGDYVYVYNIFGVSTIKANNFDLKDKFESKEDLNEYINNLKKYANLWENRNINLDSNLLTLYTCNYEFNDARLIITAELSKKIKLTKEYMKDINIKTTE